MFPVRHYKILTTILLQCLFLASCDKDEEKLKQMLQQYDWEQMGQLAWDSAYQQHKFFFTLCFNDDDTYFMETNWSLNDTLIYTESGKYEFDPGDEKIIFPYAIDTIDEGSLFLRVYLSPWHIQQLDDTLLVVQSEPGYQPPDDPGGMTRYDDEILYFRPK